MTAPHFLDLAPEAGRVALLEWCRQAGEPPFRAKQLVDFIYRQRRHDVGAMSSLPKALREALASGPLAPTLEREALLESRDGTRKFRFRLADGAAIESVWIPSGERATLCVSSQAGCPARCSFCATGASGFRRDLRPAEIIEQWLHVDAAARTGGWSPGQVTQIVFMGMGEPLLNTAAVRTVLQLLTAADGFAFSPRRITVSTVGIPPRIRELFGEFPQVRLALSLHSALDRTRDHIVPMNRKYPVAALAEVLRDLGDASARRISLEYVHLAGVNDTAEEAAALAAFAAATRAHINLLPFHPFPGAPHRVSDGAAVRRFRDAVQERFDGRITIRRSRGLDIAGACGQLVLETLTEGTSGTAGTMRSGG